MGTEQLENANREGKKRIVISRPGKPDREVWTDKTFENAPRLKTHPRDTRREVPILAKDPAFDAPIVPLNSADMCWIAYQRGWRDALKKARQQ